MLQCRAVPAPTTTTQAIAVSAVHQGPPSCARPRPRATDWDQQYRTTAELSVSSCRRHGTPAQYTQAAIFSGAPDPEIFQSGGILILPDPDSSSLNWTAVYYYYYYRFTAPRLCPGLPGWAGTGKVKPGRWKHSGARDSEWQYHQLSNTQICTSPQTDNHASIPPLSFFTVQMPFLPAAQPTASKHCCLIFINTLTLTVWL